MDKITNTWHILTLHVGLGTFQMIDTDDIRAYQIHAEAAEVDMSLFATIADLKTTKKKIVAVGTTACRTLESLPSLWRHLPPERKTLFSPQVQAFWDASSRSCS